MHAQKIAAFLGGQKMLGLDVGNQEDLARLVRAGLPAGSVTELAERLRMGSGALSRKLGIPQRTLTRRLGSGAHLTVAESDRTARMARICAEAEDSIGDREKAMEWLLTPNRALRGEAPVDLLDTDTGTRLVEDVLGRIAYGVYS